MKKPKKAPKPPVVHHHKHPHPQRHHPHSHQPARGWGGAPKPVTHKPVVRKHKPVVHHHAKAKKHPVRKLALGEGVACCSAEALAVSLRLAGVPVGDEDVLALYWRTASDADAGASILATLEAASECGLAGVRLGSFEGGTTGVGVWRRLVLKPQSDCHPPPGFPDITRLWPASTFRGSALIPSRGLQSPSQLTILGAQLPGGPHAFLADGDTWWSWGEPYCACQFPGAVIEEAWLVDWEV